MYNKSNNRVTMPLTKEVLELREGIFCSLRFVLDFKETEHDSSGDGKDNADEKANQIDVIAHCGSLVWGSLTENTDISKDTVVL